jgi:hypothetical protein
MPEIEDFSSGGIRGDLGQPAPEFSQCKRVSKAASGKIRFVDLVAVMSAVDWWKTPQSCVPYSICCNGVRWIFPPSCGKKLM